MIDVCLTLPPNLRQVLGYPYISGQNIYFVPIFLLVTSQFMFWTYQSLKKLAWVSSGGGGGVHGDQFWPMDYSRWLDKWPALHAAVRGAAFVGGKLSSILNLCEQSLSTFVMSLVRSQRSTTNHFH